MTPCGGSFFFRYPFRRLCIPCPLRSTCDGALVLPLFPEPPAIPALPTHFPRPSSFSRAWVAPPSFASRKVFLRPQYAQPGFMRRKREKKIACFIWEFTGLWCDRLLASALGGTVGRGQRAGACRRRSWRCRPCRHARRPGHPLPINAWICLPAFFPRYFVACRVNFA